MVCSPDALELPSGVPLEYYVSFTFSLDGLHDVCTARAVTECSLRSCCSGALPRDRESVWTDLWSIAFLPRGPERVLCWHRWSRERPDYVRGSVPRNVLVCWFCPPLGAVGSPCPYGGCTSVCTSDGLPTMPDLVVGAVCVLSLWFGCVLPSTSDKRTLRLVCRVVEKSTLKLWPRGSLSASGGTAYVVPESVRVMLDAAVLDRWVSRVEGAGAEHGWRRTWGRGDELTLLGAVTLDGLFVT